MVKKLGDKFLESAKSVLPISVIVLILHFTIAPMPLGTLALFVTGTFLLVLGMSIFTMGSDIAMVPMGELIGSRLTESRKLGLLLGSCFVLGIAVTVAEPDLQVLAKRVPSIPDSLLIGTVALGVGIFLLFAVLRILLQVKLMYLLIGFYAILFIIAALGDPEFLAVGFDSGGVTTGPITVPFILALGIGVSAVRSGKSAEEDSFGLCGICSIGPILAVLLLGMFYDSGGTDYTYEASESVSGIGELIRLYAHGIVEFAGEVLVALAPIVIIFGILMVIAIRIPKRQLIKIVVGLIYTLVGLTIFLTGANIGFMAAGTFIGKTIGDASFRWVLIPLGFLIGCFVVMAEPSVYTLNKQVEEITSGAISKGMMMTGLSLGVGAAVALSMVRILTGISLWYIILPGYGIAIVTMFFVPRIFTAIAFDSGGVASGAMATTFLLPLAMGACEAVGGNVMMDAFGIIALIAMMPLVTIQIMGIIYKIKLAKSGKVEETDESAAEDITLDEDDTDIVEL